MRFEDVAIIEFILVTFVILYCDVDYVTGDGEYGLMTNKTEIWKQQLEGILKSEARASHLVDQILALSLANEAQVSFKLEAVNVEEVVKESILKFLNRADILNKTDLPKEEVFVPEWGGSVFVRALTAKERVIYEQAVITRNGKDVETNLEKAIALLVALPVG